MSMYSIAMASRSPTKVVSASSTPRPSPDRSLRGGDLWAPVSARFRWSDAPAALRRCAARLPAGPGSDAAIPVFHQDLSCHLPRHHGHPSCEPSELDRISAGSRGWWSGVTNATIPFTTCSAQGPVGGQAGGADTRLFSPGGQWRMRWAPQTPQIGKLSTAKRSIDIRTPGKLRPARLGGGYAGESSADAERPAQEEAATEIDESLVTGQRDYLYRADQSDALGTSIPLAELPATVNVITEDFLEDTRAYDIEDV